jgi:hypothetical protein
MFGIQNAVAVDTALKTKGRKLLEDKFSPRITLWI